MSIQDVCERLWIHGHFTRSDPQLKRILVVKYRYMSRRGRNQAAANVDQVHRDLVSKVIHHIVHLYLHRAAIWPGGSALLCASAANSDDAGNQREQRSFLHPEYESGIGFWVGK